MITATEKAGKGRCRAAAKGLAPAALASLLVHAVVFNCADMRLARPGKAGYEPLVLAVKLGEPAVPPEGSGEEASLSLPRPTRIMVSGERELKTAVKPLSPVTSDRHAVAAEGHSDAAAAGNPPAGATGAELNPAAMAGAFRSAMRLQQLMEQSRQFYAATRLQLEAGVAARLPADALARLQGSGCRVRLEYATPHLPATTEVLCDDRRLSGELAAGFAWDHIPHPRDYSLSYRAMEITLRFDGGRTAIGLRPSL